MKRVLFLSVFAVMMMVLTTSSAFAQNPGANPFTSTTFTGEYHPILGEDLITCNYGIKTTVIRSGCTYKVIIQKGVWVTIEGPPGVPPIVEIQWSDMPSYGAQTFGVDKGRTPSNAADQHLVRAKLIETDSWGNKFNVGHGGEATVDVTQPDE